jgi:F0F1-type ATP synthase delta subunit
MKLPSSTKLLDELAAANSFNFLRDGDRQKARTFLESLSKYAPVVHISFASDPSANFMSKLTTRLRATIHPQLLITVGLEPNIAAGCILRTPNRQFDLSLRRALVGHENSLINLLKAQAGVNAA